VVLALYMHLRRNLQKAHASHDAAASDAGIERRAER
jgi:hypothetical protein